MRELNIEFQEQYKKLDKLCREMYSVNEGVTAYIQDMENTPCDEQRLVYNWDSVYKMLKHARWMRNQLAHEISIDSAFCEQSDIDRIKNFYDSVLNGDDPLTLAHKAKRVSAQKHITPQYENSSAQTEERSEVIAMQSKKANNLNVFILGLGAVCVFAGLILLIWLINSNGFTTDDLGMSFLFGFCLLAVLGVGLFLSICGYRAMARNKKMPENLIVYDNGQLIFADGYRCGLADILNVEYRQASANSGYLHSVQTYGRLTVYTKEKTITYNQVENVQIAHNRLIYLMQKSHETH